MDQTRTKADTAKSNHRPAAAVEPSRWVMIGICMFLVILVVAVFGQTVRFEFVNYDDNKFVTENQHVLMGLTLDNMRWALTAGIGGNTEDIDWWRPLSLMSHMLDVELFGLNAGGHHAMSVGIHALTAMALFLMLRAMTGAMWRSAFVAAVFAIHPQHVESVAWVSERKDVLCGLFFVLALWAYSRYAREPGTGSKSRGSFLLSPFYWLTLLLFVLGLMSKPMIVTLPCVLLLLDYWPLGRLGAVPVLRLLLEKIPFLALVPAVALITAAGPGGVAENIMEALPLSARAANAVVAYVTYLKQMVWPAGLAVFYPHPGLELPPRDAVFAGLLLASITALVVWQHKRPYLAVGWFWYLGMLVPVIGIVQSGSQSHADRYTYLPQIGLYVMLTWAVTEWTGKLRSPRWAMGLLAVGIVAALAMVARNQTAHWRDSLTLWTHTFDVTTDNSPAHLILGNASKSQGNLDEAIWHYQQALRIAPGYADVHNNLGIVLASQGKLTEALQHYQRALELNPDYAEAHNNLGSTLASLGRTNDAIEHYRHALRIKPNIAHAHNNLGNALKSQGKTIEAIACYRRALQIDPGLAPTESSLGNALVSQGKLTEAGEHYRNALRIKSDFTEARIGLGDLLGMQGKTAEAVGHFRRALDAAPDSAPVHSKLGAALQAQAKFADAIGHFTKALEIAPGDVSTLNNLGWILATCPEASLRNGPKAIELARKAEALAPAGNPALLDTLSAAYAEAGRFAEAVETALRALDIAAKGGDATAAREISERLQLYESGLPYREKARKQ